MLLKLASWQDIEDMPGFEREYFHNGAAEIYTDKKTGEIIIPR